MEANQPFTYFELLFELILCNVYVIEGGKFEMPKCIWGDVIIRYREFSRSRRRCAKNMNFSVMALA